jgi:dihydropyrimidinase
MDTIIAGGTVVTAADTFRADVGIAGGRIVALGRDLAPGPQTTLLDATSRMIIPGGVDVHTHLDSPSQGSVTADDFASGTVAAACGGTTTIVDMCFQRHGGTLADALADWHQRAAGKAVIDYGFHMVVVDLNDATAAELAALPAQGVPSFKLFMAYKGGPMVDDLTLFRSLEIARESGGIVLVHAENGDVAFALQRRLLAAGQTDPRAHALSRPPRVEAEAVARAVALAELAGAPLFVVHVSCAEALEEIARGRARGATVLAETCTHYLYATEDDLARPDFAGAKWVFTPPPRDRRQHAALWSALAHDTLQLVSSDHSAFNWRGQKDAGRDDFTLIPNGAPGIEERMIGVYQGVVQGKISLNRFVELTATAPARVFGLHPQKGSIAVGGDADLVIWNPHAELTITQTALHHKVDYTLYEGMRVRGLPETVLRRGEVIVRNRAYVGGTGGGQFLARQRFAH